MKVSTFNDGERFVVVFEGITVNDQTLIKGLLAPLSVDNIERKPEVEPIPVVEEEPPEMPVCFTDGPYAGMPPMDILTANQKEAQAAYVYICSVINDLPADLKDKCVAATQHYLKSRFESVDSVEYAAKLNDKQVAKFYELFSFNIPEELNLGDKENLPYVIEWFKCFE